MDRVLQRNLCSLPSEKLSCYGFCLFHKKEHIISCHQPERAHRVMGLYRWSDLSTAAQVSSDRGNWDPMEQGWGTWRNLRKLVQGGVATTIGLRLTLKRTEQGLRQDQVPRSATSRAVWDRCWVGYFVTRQCVLTFTFRAWRQYSQSLSEQKE